VGGDDGSSGEGSIPIQENVDVRLREELCYPGATSREKNHIRKPICRGGSQWLAGGKMLLPRGSGSH